MSVKIVEALWKYVKHLLDHQIFVLLNIPLKRFYYNYWFSFYHKKNFAFSPLICSLIFFLFSKHYNPYTISTYLETCQQELLGVYMICCSHVYFLQCSKQIVHFLCPTLLYLIFRTSWHKKYITFFHHLNVNKTAHW